MTLRIEWHQNEIDRLVKETIDNVGVPMMETVADACNEELGKGFESSDKGFQAGTTGPGEQLSSRDYRATVITADAAAIIHNRRHNTLIRNLPKAKR